MATPSPLHESTREDTLIYLLGEVPNQGAAIFGVVAFFVVSVALLVMTVKTRSWFMLTAVLTGFLEWGGFLARVSMIAAPTNPKLVGMQCLLIISPVLLAIVEYICVGKLVQRTEPGRASRWLRWQAYAFTASDFLCLFLQGGGGAMLAQANTNANSAEMGRLLLLAGLALQLGFFSLFTFQTLYIHIRPQFGYRGNAHFARVFHILYATITLLFIRNIFRVIEFVQGWRGYLAVHEVYFYVFDFAPVFLTLVLFTIWHYGRYLGPLSTATTAPAVDSAHIPATPSASSFDDGKAQVVIGDTDVDKAKLAAHAGGPLQVRPAVPLEVVTVHGLQAR